jgi:hypothetical protein
VEEHGLPGITSPRGHYYSSSKSSESESSSTEAEAEKQKEADMTLFGTQAGVTDALPDALTAVHDGNE